MNKKPSRLSENYNTEPPRPDPKGDSSIVSLKGFAVIVVAIALSIGLAVGMVAVLSDDTPEYAPADSGGSDGPLIIEGDEGSLNETALYEATSPSVVSIYSVGDGETGPESSQGSGFVYTSEGHIVTNEHVVANGNTFYIQFSNGEWTTAEITGTDSYTDLAVLNAETLPAEVEPLPMTDRVPMEGEPVIAIGTPHDLGGTVTTGIVSGVKRNMEAHSGFVLPDTIQIDAALNPGNSGGPLIGADGQVLGINRAEQGENIGFAVSSRLAERVVQGLIEDGQYDHAYVGVRTVTVTPPLADEHGISADTGVLVVETVDGSPAGDVLEGPDGSAEDGEIPNGGDLIVGVDGEDVRTNEDLSSYIMRTKSPGDTVDIEVLRDGERTTVELTLAERD